MARRGRNVLNRRIHKNKDRNRFPQPHDLGYPKKPVTKHKGNDFLLTSSTFAGAKNPSQRSLCFRSVAIMMAKRQFKGSKASTVPA